MKAVERGLVRPVVRFFLQRWIRHDELIRVRQQIRYLALAELLGRTNQQSRDLTRFELSVFSQNGEDGILVEILNRIGTQSRFFVEIGASGNEANCLVLADVFGWRGVFVDAGEIEYRELNHKYSSTGRVRVLRTYVTRESLDAGFLHASGIPPDTDVLSIDVDGNDYWLWDKWVTQPRIVIIEFNSGLPSDSQLVQPYEASRAWDSTSAFGASLGALRRLASKKGYRLVYVDLTGTNAFFVRSDLAAGQFMAEEEIVIRTPNYFLYGLRHPDTREGRPYIDLQRGDSSDQL